MVRASPAASEGRESAIRRGSVWWADLGDPVGSEPSLVRPVVVVSADSYNRSLISTVTVVSITSNVALAESPGNVRLAKGEGGLPKISVVNVTQVSTLDKSTLGERLGQLAPTRIAQLDDGLRVALALSSS